MRVFFLIHYRFKVVENIFVQIPKSYPNLTQTKFSVESMSLSVSKGCPTAVLTIPATLPDTISITASLILKKLR